MKLLLCNVRVCDQRSAYNGQACDVLVVDGMIQEIALAATSPNIGKDKATQVFDGEGAFLSSSWIDMCASFGEPGFEERETLESGAKAALSGGFGSVVTLPSTFPVLDSKSGIEFIRSRSEKLPIELFPFGCVSVGSNGKELAELFDMHQAGAVGFIDGNKTLEHTGLMLRALQYAKIFNGLILSKPEDSGLCEGGRMHEGEMSTLLGMKGIPALAESLRVHRDIELAAYAEAPIHFSRLSTKESVGLIRRAKRKGMQVTCDVAVANLCFTDDALAEYDSNFKLTPPLRSKQDQRALWDGLMDGTIDAVVSNHEPQNLENKDLEFDYASTGMLSLETFLPMLNRHKPKSFEWDQLIAKVTQQPAKILGLTSASIEVGQPADFTIFDPEKSWTYTESVSKSKNSPWLNQTLKGKVMAVFTKNKFHQL